MSGNGSFRAPPPAELQRHFRQYSIDAFVAVGGMGAVYRATQISVDRPVALKILPPEMAGDLKFRERFALEAKAMAKLSHRNLVQLYDFGETDGIFWMTQEWVEGRTIFEVMHEEKRLSPSEAAALVAQACEGLGYAHKQGIVHRDVKPANMMVDKDGILKLMDFGLAGVHGGEGGMKTREGKRFATEEYAAPEVWDAKAVIDHRVDIFALGVLLYEALTGKRPTGTFRMPSELRPGLDRRFDEIVVRAMQRKPEDRYGSCAELLTALRAVVTSAPKVKLQTAAKPATRGLKVKPSPLTPPPTKRGPLTRAPIVEKKESTREMPVPLVTPVVAAPARKKSATGPVIVAGVLLLSVLVVGGWMILAGGGADDSAKRSRAAGEEENGRSGSGGPAGSDTPKGRPETAQERIDRQARERRARLEAARKAGTLRSPDSPPQPEPAPSPALGTAQLLAALDEELRTNVEEPFKAFSEARAGLQAKYLAECAKEEEKAVQAGDLDAVLLWMAEARAVRSGTALPVEQVAPPRALALRKRWRERIDPLKAPLASLQSTYLEKCAELEKTAESEGARAALQERREKAAVFAHFLALCAGEAPPFAPDPVPGSEEEELRREEVEVGGSLDSLDARLQSGKLSKLPAGAREYEGNYYLLVQGPLGWQEAKSWCEERGGHLATLAGKEEQQWFGRTLGGGGVRAFLGARRAGDGWVWITGERWEANPPWAAGQPNNYEGKQSVLGWKDRGFNDLAEEPAAFVIEWEKDALKRDLLERIRESLPGSMVEAYQSTRGRLSELKEAGNTSAMVALVKSYGRTLVKAERDLTRQRKIGAAKAARAIKNEMLVLLNSLDSGPGPEPGPVQPVAEKSLLVIRNGNPTEDCSFDKKHWRRRGRVFQNQEEEAKLASRLALGAGDFKVALKLTTRTKVGGSGFYLSLGDLYLYFDSESGAVECWNGWSKDKSRTAGVQLGSIVKAGAPFECAVERKGETVRMLLNGKPAVSAKVHSAALGVVTMGAGKAVLGIESFQLEGSLIEAPRETILHKARSSSNWYAGQTQLLRTSEEGLVALYVIWQGKSAATIRTNRSRDGGRRWEEGVTLIDPKNSRQMPVWSFAAAANQRRDEVWLAYAVGSANHKLFVKTGRNGGRNWTQPVEVTKVGKEAGENVSFAGQGLVVTHNPAKRGRIILPMMAGGEEKRICLLVSESGREWKKIGPVTGVASGLAEIVEDLDGKIWLATGVPSGNRSHGRRLWVTSTDGGDTWSEPEQSSLPDAGIRGSLAVTEGAGRKAVWYYATVDGPVGQATPERNNLTLFGSKDAGKTWQALRRFHFGNGDSPSVVPLRDGAVGITFKRQTWNNNGDQVRYVEVNEGP